MLRGGSILNELPDVPAENLLLSENPDDGGLVIEIEKIVVHPKFNPFTYEHDIALITLKKTIRPSRDLFPICLPAPPKTNNEFTDYSGEEVAITGWGCESEHCAFDESPRFLQETVMTAIPNDLAMCWYVLFIRNYIPDV